MVRSLYSGVSGLKSHQTRMDVIGNNIANVNTYGFKASRTSFSDIYYQYQRTETGGRATYAGNNPSQVGYGVQVASIDKDMSMSSFQNTGRTLDLAIAGDGLFMCGSLDRNGQINSVTYTRMGNFGIDSVGNLVNANNEFILGTVNTSRLDGGTYSTTEMIDKDPADTPNELDTINVNELVWDAYKPECQIEYDDVASKYKPTTAEDGTTTGGVIFEGVDPYDDTKRIAYDYHMNTSLAAENGGVAADDAEGVYSDDKTMLQAYLDSLEADGGADNAPTPGTEYQVRSDYILYSVNGKFVNNQGVVYDTDKGLYTDKNGNCYEYRCYTTVNDQGELSKRHVYTLKTPVIDETTGEQAKNDDGTLQWEEGGREYTYNDITGSYEAADARGNTIYADMTDGALKYSDLDGFTIGADGVLTAQYASEMRSLGRIELATFDNVEGLTEIGDTAFAQSPASGEANIKRPGDSGAGEIQSSKLEMSNVNLANEFSDMIVTQRGYQANARIITTSDSMLEELVNLKR